MDRGGCGGWNSSGEQDQGSSSSSSSGGVGGSGGGGSSTSSDAFYGSGKPSDLYDSERQYYNTNNNDYSKYAGGPSDYETPTTSYNPYGTSPPGGYYATHPGSPGYRDGQGEGYASSDYAYTANSSDYLQPKHDDNLNHSDYDSSQCHKDSSGQGYDCSQSGYSNYSQYSRQEYTPSRVQVTAKVLFGSVNAISNLKQKKNTKKT